MENDFNTKRILSEKENIEKLQEELEKYNLLIQKLTQELIQVLHTVNDHNRRISKLEHYTPLSIY